LHSEAAHEADRSIKQRLDIAAEAAVRAGAQVVSIRLSDYALPMYDGGLESQTGLPDNARALHLRSTTAER
jgi:NAD(P)H-dependent FMN reductase